MTSAPEVIVLSSSPIPPARTPTQPSNDLKRLHDISPRGATPPPLNSTSDLLDLPSHSRFFAEPLENEKGTKKTRNPTRKALAPSVIDENASSKLPKRGKKVAKELNTAALGDIGTGSLESRDTTADKPNGPTKGRKKTNTKSKEAENMKLAGKVTKANGDTQPKKPRTTKKRASVAPEEHGAQESNVLGNDEELHLPEAMRRRRDWTPPRETASGDVIAIEADNASPTYNSTTTDGFEKLLSDYNFAGAPSESHTLSLNADGAGPTKRRRIELVALRAQPQAKASDSAGESSAQGDDSSSETKPKKKTKAPKRPTTLTARMTAQYTMNNESDNVDDDVAQLNGKSKSRRGKTKMTENETVFTVLSPEAAAKALDDQDLVFGTCSQLEREDSPQALRETQQAIKESESLVLEERERGSIPEAEKNGALEPASSRSASRITGTRNMWSVAARNTDGSLARARDVDACDSTAASRIVPTDGKAALPSETALDDDWFELDYGKPGPSRKKTSLSEKMSNSTVNAQPSRAEPASRAEDIQEKPANTTYADPQQSSMPQYSGFTDAELSKQVASYGFKSVRGRKKMIELLQKCWKSKHGSSNKPPDTEPRLQAETATPATAQSQTQEVPAAMPEKSSKSKSKAQGKSQQTRTVRTSTETTTQTEKALTASPKKTSQKQPPSGQAPSSSSFIDVEEILDSQEEVTPPPISTPRKASKSGHVPSSSSFIDIEEIQDSEDEITPSPSRVQKRYTEIYANKVSSAPEPSLDILTKKIPQTPSKLKSGATKTAGTKKVSAPASPSKPKQQSSKRSSLPGISAQITKAVRGQPQLSSRSSTGSRSHPTWHEKMLMYDPIILEDFTTWLNVEGLGLVGEDREVSTTDAREWCESKGICCCWKNSATW